MRSQTGFKWSKIVFIGFKWSKVSKIVGTMWNEVETGYGQLEIATMTALDHHKFTKWVPKRY